MVFPNCAPLGPLRSQIRKASLKNLQIARQYSAKSVGLMRFENISPTFSLVDRRPIEHQELLDISPPLPAAMSAPTTKSLHSRGILPSTGSVSQSFNNPPAC